MRNANNFDIYHASAFSKNNDNSSNLNLSLKFTVYWQFKIFVVVTNVQNMGEL